jgi:hypothetical protein
MKIALSLLTFLSFILTSFRKLWRYRIWAMIRLFSYQSASKEIEELFSCFKDREAELWQQSNSSISDYIFICDSL